MKAEGKGQHRLIRAGSGMPRMEEEKLEPRLNPYVAAPETMKPMVALDRSLKESGLDPKLMELVKIRASQINECAYCIQIHASDARKSGESEERLYLLNAWRETALYNERERAALAWTEALTSLAQSHPADEVYEALAPHFSDEEKVKLTMLISTINAWNRIAVGFRSVHPAIAKHSR